jgi:hypothetical protein
MKALAALLLLGYLPAAAADSIGVKPQPDFDIHVYAPMRDKTEHNDIYFLLWQAYVFDFSDALAGLAVRTAEPGVLRWHILISLQADNNGGYDLITQIARHAARGEECGTEQFIQTVDIITPRMSAPVLARKNAAAAAAYMRKPKPLNTISGQ